MIWLGISIVAVIILVWVALRRLPYLRTHRPGMEITPRSYIAQTPWWHKIGQTFASLKDRLTRRSYPPQAPTPGTPNPMVMQSYSPDMQDQNTYDEPLVGEPVGRFAESVGPGERTVMVKETNTVVATSVKEAFWQEETDASPAPFDLPAKGLVTRRGEAQKIAHELIVQADESFRKKNFKDAEKYYLQAATKDPDNARIYNRLGVIYLQTKNFKDAIEAFRGAIKFDDRVASRHFNLALAYLGKRDYRSAERGLKEAMRLDPTNEKYRQLLDSLPK